MCSKLVDETLEREIMRETMTLPTFAAEYDIIFVGGGASAGVAAGRLAAAAPKLRILLLEAGPLTKDMPEHVQPGRYITHLVPTTTTITHNVAKPSEYLGGRSAIVQSGRCVGGGSSVNFVLYNRPSASDFDDWATVYDNPGWSSKDMIPLLQKVETYEVDPSAPTHGSSGPLKVSYGGFFSDAGQQLLDIGPKYDKRRVLGKDGNACGVSSINTFARWPKWCSSDGKRSDVPHHYVYNQIGSTGLDLVHGGRVKRVLFDDKTATGVEF
ncbi:GMC oxidoreductase family protein, partial [Pleurotus pulmonarius]